MKFIVNAVQDTLLFNANPHLWKKMNLSPPGELSEQGIGSTNSQGLPQAGGRCDQYHTSRLTLDLVQVELEGAAKP